MRGWRSFRFPAGPGSVPPSFLPASLFQGAWGQLPPGSPGLVAPWQGPRPVVCPPPRPIPWKHPVSKGSSCLCTLGRGGHRARAPPTLSTGCLTGGCGIWREDTWAASRPADRPLWPPGRGWPPGGRSLSARDMCVCMCRPPASLSRAGVSGFCLIAQRWLAHGCPRQNLLPRGPRGCSPVYVSLSPASASPHT